MAKKTKAERLAQKAAQKAEKERRKQLLKLSTKKGRKKEAKARRKAQKALKSGNSLLSILNRSPVASLPLSPEEELIRQMSVAGDFVSLNKVWPLSVRTWSKKIPLGKYRFTIENGQKVYLPWTDTDLQRFLNGPWVTRNPKTGFAPLIHPKRKKRADKAARLNQFSKKQSNRAAKFSPNDPRHVLDIYPGEYVFGPAEESTWTKARGPVAVAAAIVASVYFGPAVLAKLKALAAAHAGGGAAGAGAAKGALASKVAAGSKTLLSYAGKAATIKAVADGTLPPPPMDVNDPDFTDWAVQVAGDEWLQDYGESMTEDDEQIVRDQIQDLQRRLAATSYGTPVQPSPYLPPQLIEVAKEKKAEQNSGVLLALAALAGLILVGG